MNFAPDGSGSNGMRAQNAFVNYFSYPNATYVQKADYSSTAWEDLLKEQLDNGVPMYYSGSGTEVGHAWNCDGYQGTNYFHFNLGWGGSYNGYFYLNSIVAGGNTLTYYQAAITNAVPGNYTITQPRIQLEAQNCMAGDPFELYVNTYPVLNSWNVQDYSLSIFYEHNTLEYIGADLTGTIAEGGNLTVDASQPGYLHITWDRSTPLFGGGRLLNVHFQSIEPGEFLFMPVDMSYNGQMLSNAEPLMVSIDAAVENMADSRITMTNAMHVGYNTLASLPVNTSYLLPSWNVQHYEFELSFDPQKVQFHDAITEGTLSEIEGDLQSEILSPGLVRISFDSQSPITGSIDLLVIPRFLAIGNGSTNIPTVVSMSNFYYNETAVSSAPNGVILLSPSTSSEEQFPAAVLSVQNYPNPFNPSTTIMLNIPQTGMVKAAIYNLKGQLVYSL
ncbi:MAG: C10 family peptidase, partial [Candidatus Cloacimonetes bacterium]|nr:C10 family peptidase [Candidatus Cloacimonadota bacterium]